jgi:hypothetical protein
MAQAQGRVRVLKGKETESSSGFLYAFDLIELNGDDLRREPLDTCLSLKDRDAHHISDAEGDPSRWPSGKHIRLSAQKLFAPHPAGEQRFENRG